MVGSSTYLNMNILMLNSCQRFHTMHTQTHTHIYTNTLAQSKRSTSTHPLQHEFLSKQHESVRLAFYAAAALHIPVLGPDSTNHACRGRRMEASRSHQQLTTKWDEGGQPDQGLCFSLVIGSVWDLNTFNRCLPEPWAMKQQTVEEFALCAVVSLFSAAPAADSAWLDGGAHHVLSITVQFSRL